MPSSKPFYPLNKQLKYKLFPQKLKEREFWKNLEINIDAFCDRWLVHQEKLERLLKEFSASMLKKVCDEYKLDNNPGDNYQHIILKDQKAAIDFYCCLKFSLTNIKTLSRYFKIPIKNGKIDRVRVFMNVLDSKKNAKLPLLFLLQYAQKKGSVKIPFDIAGNTRSINFAETQNFIQKLVRHLNTSDSEGREHVLRFSIDINNDYYYLILKETTDSIYPALPDNARVQAGKYILIRFIGTTGRLMIDTQNPKEAFKIKNFIARKSKTSIRYVKISAQYNPRKFFDAITAEKNINSEIKLVDAGFRETKIGNFKLGIKEAHKKNDIIHVINWLKNRGILKLENFSEFENLVFSSKGINYTIIIHENSWGQLKLKIIDKNKPAVELAAFRKAFEKAYNIPFDATLKHENQTIDRVSITRKIIDNKTIRAEMPEEVEEILLDLMIKNFIYKPTENAKRRCIKCHHISWEKGDCRICGNETYFDGDFLDISINTEYFSSFFIKSISAIKHLGVTRTIKQIESRKYSFIDVINQDGDYLSIFISQSNPPQSVLEHFARNGNPLLVILLRYNDALKEDLKNKNFESCDFAELVNNNMEFSAQKVIEAIRSQMNKWRMKVIEKGLNSYQSLCAKKPSYDDQDFENDIYNILHEMFLIGDRMGGKFTGTKAPDGVLSIQNYAIPRKRYCIAWDCKYSVNPKGYQLNDKPQKHRHYLLKLSGLEKVRFFGGLNTYAIISQNMDPRKYKKFYDKVRVRARWKGKIILLEEKNLLLLYKVYKDNEGLISSYPKVFYQRAYNLLKQVPLNESEPYLFVSNERILKIFENMKKEFALIHKRFKFNRLDFA